MKITDDEVPELMRILMNPPFNPPPPLHPPNTHTAALHIYQPGSKVHVGPSVCLIFVSNMNNVNED